MPGYTNHNLTDIACEIKHQTAAAYLINDGLKEVWLPKSLTEVNDEDPKNFSVTIPEWLAMEKGLI